jgi:type I restriction enzyme S subunit
MGQELFKEWFRGPLTPWRGNWEETTRTPWRGNSEEITTAPWRGNWDSLSTSWSKEKSPLGDLGAKLPEGWRVGKLGEMGTIICWKTPSKNNLDFFGWNIPFIKIPDMHWNLFILKTEDSLTEKGADSQINKYIPEWAICVSCIATVGLVALTTKPSQTNQQINSIIPKFNNYREYLYYTLIWMKDELLAMGAWWSATLNINTTSFSNIPIIIPDQETLSKFDLVIKPIFSKIRANLEQIQSLSATRDQLLPKLMSGEVRVEF